MMFTEFTVFIVFLGLKSYLCKDIQHIDHTISVSNKGLWLPRLGIGTAALGAKTQEIVLFALNSGIQLIDTAQATEWYDEISVGLALKQYKRLNPNKDVFVVTKIHPRDFEVNRMKVAIERSQKNILGNTETPLDLVLLHSPYCWTGHCTKEQESHSWKSAWKSLEELKRNNKILAIGVSNFDSNLLHQLISIADSKVSVIQNWMDPFNQDKTVREIASKHGCLYMAYSSLGTQWERKLRRNPVFTSRVLISIASRYNSTVSGVVLSWLLQRNVVAIPRTNQLIHLTQNAAFLTHSNQSTQLHQHSTDDSSSKQISVFLDSADLVQIDTLDGTLGSLWD